MDEKQLKMIEGEAARLLDFLKIQAAITSRLGEDGVVYLSLESEDTGLLIGYHGQTLASLQLIFNLIIYKKMGQWVKIILNVGDWRERREDYLKKMALSLAQRVEATGEAVACPYLMASERRIVHLALQDHPYVATESQGEGESRRLIIKPRQ